MSTSTTLPRLDRRALLQRYGLLLLSFTSPLSPGPIRLRLRPGSSTLALGTSHVLWFDGAGRLITAYRDGRLYKRGLDRRVMAK